MRGRGRVYLAKAIPGRYLLSTPCELERCGRLRLTVKPFIIKHSQRTSRSHSLIQTEGNLKINWWRVPNLKIVSKPILSSSLKLDCREQI